MGVKPVISFEKVSKQYQLRLQKSYIVHEAVRKIMRKRAPMEEFWALRDVSFSVQPGETVAFVGGNGAGKSTLLGLVAGTLFPTSGHITVRGRIGALLELGAGFHPDLSGRENIFLNASLLGMQREEVEACYEEIVAFAELGDFIDAPLRTYSSGMHVRLGFSVAVHIDPQILIVDEVLAVGDLHFQTKCAKHLARLKESGCTLLFVSHSATAVEKHCQRVIWLDHGRLKADGPIKDVLPAYEAAMK